MADKHEAMVHELTAEVRVLRVGSRQVTLSVVRQLDWADPRNIDPFGRVRTGDIPPGGAGARGEAELNAVKSADPVEVIGSAGGNLVRSVAWRTLLTCSGEGSFCPQKQALAAEIDKAQASTPPWQEALDRFAAHGLHDWARYGPDEATFTAWQKLPLIVLANFR